MTSLTSIPYSYDRHRHESRRVHRLPVADHEVLNRLKRYGDRFRMSQLSVAAPDAETPSRAVLGVGNQPTKARARQLCQFEAHPRQRAAQQFVRHELRGHFGPSRRFAVGLPASAAKTAASSIGPANSVSLRSRTNQVRYPYLQGNPRPFPGQERKAPQSPRSLAPAGPMPRPPDLLDQAEGQLRRR